MKRAVYFLRNYINRNENNHWETAILWLRKKLWVNRHSIVIVLTESISWQTTFCISQPQLSETWHIYCARQSLLHFLLFFSLHAPKIRLYLHCEENGTASPAGMPSGLYFCTLKGEWDQWDEEDGGEVKSKRIHTVRKGII